MAKPKGKRTIDNFDPLASDSQDSDYDDKASATTPKKKRKSAAANTTASSSKPSQRPKKRRRADSDIEDDEEDNVSLESWTPESEQAEPEINPNTGRPARRTAKRVKTYEESDASAIEESVEEQEEEQPQEEQEEEEDEEEVVQPARRLTRRAPQTAKLSTSAKSSVGVISRAASSAPANKDDGKPKRSLVVKFRLAPKDLRKLPGAEPEGQQSSRPPSRNQSPPRPPSRNTRAATAAMAGIRRSSRLSHEPEEFYELTDSGRHSRIAAVPQSREQSAGPSTRQNVGGKGPAGKGPAGKGPGKGPAGKGPAGKGPAGKSFVGKGPAGKGLKKFPSMIAEESQETSQYSKHGQQETAASPEAFEVAESREQSAEPTTAAAAEEEEGEAENVEMTDVEGAGDNDMAEAAVEDVVSEDEEMAEAPEQSVARSIERPDTRSTSRNKRKRAASGTSDFNPDEVEEENDDGVSASSDDEPKRKKRRPQDSRETSGSAPIRTSARIAANKAKAAGETSESEDDIDQDELAEEAAELQQATRRGRRANRDAEADGEIQYARKLRAREKKTEYNVVNSYVEWGQKIAEVQESGEEDTYEKAPAGAIHLLSVAGPFGYEPSIFKPLPGSLSPVNGSDFDDSSDEDDGPSTHGVIQTPSTSRSKRDGGAPANFGKVTKKAALADVSPLGVDEEVNFSSVGGLDEFVNQLKEMVVLPLQYPELYKTQGIPPPRGVLFHGPPGNGKTLLARALASESTIAGKKITFFMRKGADVLNKYVGEAERQLRLLFEEAQRCQPSIIFFDEIDGLAPVRSSKQEQIHASIVASLLALMDGMDDRGQVVVIGATNRPDHVDPALRRPGRFDREFLIPLPNVEGRRAILDIHTRKWNPPLEPEFKDHLAAITKGYSGADLRALCSDSALHAIQATYPQIYTSKRKLLVDPTQIKVLPKDFMVTLKKIVPSSERSAALDTGRTKKRVDPLIRGEVNAIMELIEEILPQKKSLTSLEEALYDDRTNSSDFDKIATELEFDEARIHRPRLLIYGPRGMGQQYLAKAVLQKLESTHMQAFDLPTLLEDSTRTPESAIIAMFKEVRRRKPAIIFIPNIDVWWRTVQPSVAALFSQLLRSLDPNDPVLLLGIAETDSPDELPDTNMVNELFGFTTRGDYQIRRPNVDARKEFFAPLIAYIRAPPNKMPDPEHRPARELPQLPFAPIEEESGIRAGDPALYSRKQRKQDLITLSQLKTVANPIMQQLKKTYHKTFGSTPIRREEWEYLGDTLVSDLSQERQSALNPERTWIPSTDENGIEMLQLSADPSVKLYNVCIDTIEKRMEHGCYTRPKDLLDDCKRLMKDQLMLASHPNLGRAQGVVVAKGGARKACEMVANMFVDIENFYNVEKPQLVEECERIHKRQTERKKLAKLAAERAAAARLQLPNTRKAGAPTENGAAHMPATPMQGPITPQQRPRSSDYGTHQSNGESVPSRGTQNGLATAHPAGFGTPNPTGSMLQQGSQQQSQHTQRSVFEKMAPGSTATDYHNSASTTTSGQKTSDRSNRTSDRSQALGMGMGTGMGPGETQSTNGSGREYPDFSMMEALSGGSQIPDTQPNSGSAKAAVSFDSGADVYEVVSSSQNTTGSQAAAAASSQPAPSSTQFSVPALPPHASRTTSAGGGGGPASTVASSTAQPVLIINEPELRKLHSELAQRSSGLSVEQLEQVLAALMDAVWRSRTKWNRMVVARDVEQAFNRVIEQIERKQLVLKSSLEEAAAAARKGGADHEMEL